MEALKAAMTQLAREARDELHASEQKAARAQAEAAAAAEVYAAYQSDKRMLGGQLQQVRAAAVCGWCRGRCVCAACGRHACRGADARGPSLT